MTEVNVTMTESAAKRIAKIIASEADKNALRISVEGGGCSGFSYKFDLTGDRQDDDIVIERDNARVLIDQMSLIYMEGSEIDFVDNLLASPSRSRTPMRWQAAAAAPASPSDTVTFKLHKRTP